MVIKITNTVEIVIKAVSPLLGTATGAAVSAVAGTYRLAITDANNNGGGIIADAFVPVLPNYVPFISVILSHC
jgi:uncharacterized membrane protein